MEELDGFAIEDGHGLYRPVCALVSFDEAVVLVRAAIAAARKNELRDLLVDTTTLTGFSSPDKFGRFLAAVAWSDESKGDVRLAMVAKAEMIHPQKYAVTIAADLGLVSNIFTSELKARTWLDTQHR